jgi:hypothetical protein
MPNRAAEDGEIYKEQTARQTGCGSQLFNGGVTSSQTVANNLYSESIECSDVNCQANVSAVIFLMGSCDTGRSVATFGRVSGIPSGLPTLVAVQYGDRNCALEPISIQFYSDSVCTNGYTTVQCQNNSADANVTFWNSNGCTGGGSWKVHPAGSSAAPPACGPNNDQHFCSFDSSQYVGNGTEPLPTSTGSASGSAASSGSASASSSGASSSSSSSTGDFGAAVTAAVSMGSLVLAAIVALVGRQL